jgi:hypothetical protein
VPLVSVRGRNNGCLRPCPWQSSSAQIPMVNSQHPYSSAGIGLIKIEVPGSAGPFAGGRHAVYSPLRSYLRPPVPGGNGLILRRCRQPGFSANSVRPPRWPGLVTVMCVNPHACMRLANPSWVWNDLWGAQCQSAVVGKLLEGCGLRPIELPQAAVCGPFEPKRLRGFAHPCHIHAPQPS